MSSELTHNMFKDGSIFSLVSIGWGDALASDSPFKERVLIRKVKTMELK